jgi:redox-sensing transcriptional repressor
MKAIEDFLGWNNVSEAFLVGAGHLGAALLGYQGFKDYGLDIVAAFDNDPAKGGTEIHGKKVFPFRQLPQLVKRMGIKIGVMAVPASCAQEVAGSMIEAGIRAIWNFAPVRISVPAHIIVQHENLASSLAVLSKKLATAAASEEVKNG